MSIYIIKDPITRAKLREIAEERFGDLAKAAVDIEKEIMAVGGELHIDEETKLIEEEMSENQNVWGINLYPDSGGENFIEFDSVINLKPASGNRSRGVGDPATAEKIRAVVTKLIK